MSVGVGKTFREHCDGQGLASPGRWPVARKRYPDSDMWQRVVSSHASFAQQHGTPELLVRLVLGKVRECPLKAADVQELKNEVVVKLASMGMDLTRCSGDRNNVPIDFRFLDLLLRAAGDPEVGLGVFAQGVRVGPGARMPRLPALHKLKEEVESGIPS